MSRKITLTLGDKVIEAPADFRAMEEVDKRVGCPITILGRPGGVGITQREAINAIAVAIRLAGDKRSHLVVAEEVYESASMRKHYYTQAARYLVAILGGDPDAEPEAEGTKGAE